MRNGWISGCFVIMSLWALQLSAMVPRTLASDWAYNPATGNSYRLSSSNTRSSANAQATMLGGYLAIINDSAENDWLVSTFGGQPEYTALWIGFSDSTEEGTWRWEGDSAHCAWTTSSGGSCYVNWNVDEPSNTGPHGNEDHAMIYISFPENPGAVGKWNDGDANEDPAIWGILGGIIERPGPPPTGPTHDCSVAPRPTFIAVHPTLPRAYVTHDNGAILGNGGLTVLETGPCVSEISVRDYRALPDAHGLTITPDGQKLIIAGQNANNVLIVNLDSAGDVVDPVIEIPVGSSPGLVACNSTGTLAYVTNWDDNTVSIIDIASASVQSTCSVGSGPRGILLSPDDAKFYVAHDFDDTVTEYDALTCGILDGPLALPLAPGWMGMAMSADGSNLFVPNNDSAGFSFVSTSPLSLDESVSTAADPTGVALSPDGTRVFAAMSSVDQVWVLDSATHTHLDTVAAGDNPLGIAINPQGNRLLIVNHDSPSVTVVAVGDIDGDGVADGQDACSTTMLCQPVDCGGRPRLDLNEDCKVDGLDIQFMVEQLLSQ